MAVLPVTHAAENQKLNADAYVDLWEIALQPSGIVCVKNDGAVTWQGKVYEWLPVKTEGVERNADEQRSRPTFSVANPDRRFGPYIANGQLDKAIVTRKRVLLADLAANRAIYQSRSWIVARIAKLVGPMLSVELRELSDGPNFVIPGRVFSPPDFPVVSLF